eukprot:247502-Amphidinium_carterae.1
MSELDFSFREREVVLICFQRSPNPSQGELPLGSRTLLLPSAQLVTVKRALSSTENAHASAVQVKSRRKATVG